MSDKQQDGGEGNGTMVTLGLHCLKVNVTPSQVRTYFLVFNSPQFSISKHTLVCFAFSMVPLAFPEADLVLFIVEKMPIGGVVRSHPVGIIRQHSEGHSLMLVVGSRDRWAPWLPVFMVLLLPLPATCQFPITKLQVEPSSFGHSKRGFPIANVPKTSKRKVIHIKKIGS